MKQIKSLRYVRELTLIVFLIFFSLSFLQAQNSERRTITGKVSIGTAGAGIEGASILVKGTKNIVTSFSEGNFTIIAQPGDILVVSFIGYKSKEIKIEEKTTSLSVNLSEDFSNLQEVVVVGYGKTKKNLTSAVLLIQYPAQSFKKQ